MASKTERKEKQNRSLVFMALSVSMMPKKPEMSDFFLMIRHFVLPVLLVCISSNLNFIIKWNGE